MEYTESLTEDLIAKAQEGDQEAFGEIFEICISPVYRFVLFRIADSQNAETLTEEIFLKVWQDLPKFRPHGKVSFIVWVFQIAHKVAEQFLKKMKKTSSERKEFLQKKHAEELATAEEQEQYRLQTMFSLLPNTQAEVVIYKYFCELSNTEIASIMDKTEGAVRILQSRGLKKLRELLETE